MKKIAQLGTLISIIALAILSACGGGGGGAGTSPVVLTKATLKLITSGTGTTIYGIDVTVNLADGVTVKSANPPQVDAAVVTPSGVAGPGTIATAVYTAATGTFPGKVRILAANANGFTIGEFCTLNGDIASGHTPGTADFSLGNFSAADADGNVINGLTSHFTADIL